jgi:hypothetical protein
MEIKFLILFKKIIVLIGEYLLEDSLLELDGVWQVFALDLSMFYLVYSQFLSKFYGLEDSLLVLF